MGSAVLPYGDVKQLSGPGFGLAGFAEYKYEDHWAAWRLRGEYMALDDKKETVQDELGPTKSSHSSKMGWAAIDLVMYSNLKGFYAFYSFGYASLGVDSSVSPNGDSPKKHLDFDGFAWGTGVGYWFTEHLGAEIGGLRIHSKIAHKSYPDFMQASFMYRF